MVPVDARAHSKHVQVTRCDMKPEQVEKSSAVAIGKKNNG
jgi:hypothetical protein